MRLRYARLVGLVFAVAMVTSAAGALTVPSTVVEAAPGSVHLLVSEPSPAGDVGKECGATVVTSNNTSVREGSDLIVKSGSEFTIPNVEHDTLSHTFKATIILGSTLTVSVRLGPEGAYSGGVVTVDVVCPQVGPPVSSPPAPPVVAPPVFTG